jgi:hypothetical protein
MNHIIHQIMHIVEGMSPHHWLLVLAAMIAVGFFTMRGVGSRSHY